MYKKEYERWLAASLSDPDLLPELLAIRENENEIKERFGAALVFGTAGLRGVLGAGINRMNIYTVAKATQGLANYINKAKSRHAVAIAYDSRHKSELFAKTAAEVLAANGIKAYLYRVLMPTPALSYAVRALKCDAGIMITASHNPAKYNGYKAYGPDGCQMTNEAADAVLFEIEHCDIFKDIKHIPFDLGFPSGVIEWMPDFVEQNYYAAVKKQSPRPEVFAQANLKVVYTPLNGTGNLPVRRVLTDMGIKDIALVKEQELPNGDFPTCPYPNPEIQETLALGVQMAQQISADLLLATDPDADRVGIAVKTQQGYSLLSGNEVGVLLVDYLAKAHSEKGTLPKNAVIVRSIVTTSLADLVAKEYNIETIAVLTGFKYIGEQILRLEQKGEEGRFLFGFEESYGYLAGSYVRDKDAVVASMLICEMASYYKLNGSSLYERLQEIYAKYGRYLHKVDSFAFEGLLGMEQMNHMMKELRKNTPKEIGGLSVEAVTDYKHRHKTVLATGEVVPTELPEADVLVYTLEKGAEVVVRPSGTEPKIKAYYTTREATLGQSQKQQELLSQAVKHLLAIK